MLRIGIDLDHTLVDYRRVLIEFVRKQPYWSELHKRLGHSEDSKLTKELIRDQLRLMNPSEELWQQVQAFMYTEGLLQADVSAGALECLRVLNSLGAQLVIVSQKGERLDFPSINYGHISLHESARQWLGSNGIISNLGLVQNAFFVRTRDEKIAKIKELSLDWFIDDLPEVIGHKNFPKSTWGVWYDPAGSEGRANSLNWPQIRAQVERLEKDRIEFSTLAPGWQLMRPVRAGLNNRSYFGFSPDSEPAFIKVFTKHDHLARDRYASESTYYSFLAEKKVSGTLPVLKSWPAASAIAWPWFEGHRILLNPVSDEDFKEILNHLREIMSAATLNDVLEYPAVASEAHLSFSNTIAIVDARLKLLEGLGEVGPLLADAKTAWNALCQNLRNRLAEDFNKDFAAEDLILSPSDVGLHNALKNDQNYYFFDYEYAGRDHPAKLLSDLTLQPEHVYSEDQRAALLEFAKVNLNSRQQMVWRKSLPVFAFKWFCILLNDFQPQGRQRRQEALAITEADWQERLNRQKEKATEMLARARELAAEI